MPPKATTGARKRIKIWFKTQVHAFIGVEILSNILS